MSSPVAPPPAPAATTAAAAKSAPGDLLPGFSALRVGDDAAPALPASTLSLDDKLEALRAITGGAAFTADTEARLREVLASKTHPVAYDGFEPSGRVTLAAGLLRVLNARRLLAAGCRVRLWVADVHALLNNKFGGDLKKIQSVSAYTVEVWKALGLDPAQEPQLEILLASSEIARHAEAYWSRVLDIAGRFSVERVQQCVTVMGRLVEDPSGSEATNTNRIMYPLMQCADGFLLDADIYQLGQDQDAAHALVQEYLTATGNEKKPAFVSHPLLLGLKQDQFKMSTTDAESAIYVDDGPAELRSKVKKAYCPPGQVEGNPILQYMKALVFPLLVDGQSGATLTLERSDKNGGNLEFTSYDELEAAYRSEQVHPADLKPCLIKYLDLLLEPVRQHFAGGELKKLWTNIKKLKVSPQPDADKLVTLSIPPRPDTVDNEWQASTLTPEERFAVARSVGEECIQESELKALLEKRAHPICYDGFEPSGRMHIAQGVLRTVNVNKLTSAGSMFRFWVADWFAMLNSKMGGDLDKIRTVGKYMVEIWKSAGMDMTNVEFLWASTEIIDNGANYWIRVMDIARRTTIARTVKCCTIMGRQEKSGMLAAQIMYPLMQCADIFFLKADICQLGMDQRKINMLARDYADLVKAKFKPVVLSHHMLMGLQEGQEKMSKSNPESAIFMEDTAEDVTRKVANAFCPEGVVAANPILDYMKHIIFPRFAGTGVSIALATGETVTFANYDELEPRFVAKEVTPAALKTALTVCLNEILEPVRLHFTQGEAKELLAQVRSFRITR